MTEHTTQCAAPPWRQLQHFQWDILHITMGGTLYSSNNIFPDSTELPWDRGRAQRSLVCCIVSTGRDLIWPKIAPLRHLSLVHYSLPSSFCRSSPGHVSKSSQREKHEGVPISNSSLFQWENINHSQHWEPLAIVGSTLLRNGKQEKLKCQFLKFVQYHELSRVPLYERAFQKNVTCWGGE